MPTSQPNNENNKTAELRESVPQLEGVPAGPSREELRKLNENLVAQNARLQAEVAKMGRALEQKSEQLRLFIRHAPAALAMFDTEMRYLAVSRRWLSDLGLGERDLIGACHYDVFPEISEELRAAHRRGLAGEVLRADVERFDRADGSVQWISWELRPWHHPGRAIGGIVIFAEDLTAVVSERRRAEEALRNSEDRFSILFGKASLPAVLSRFPDHKFVDVNDAWVQLFGYSREEAIGKTSIELGISRDAHQRTRAIGELRQHKQMLNQERTVFPKSGEVRTVLININTVTFDGEEYALTSLQDITERKRAEAELQRTNENLELRVRERTEDLLAALDRLSKEAAERRQTEERLQQALQAAGSANSIMSHMLRTIAHEFRTPLGLLSGSTDILDRYWDRLSPEQRLEQNEQIRNATRQISSLVKSVTTLPIVGNDVRPSSPQLLDVGALSRSIAAEVEKVWSGGHEFVVSLAEDCDSALLDEVLFRRILQNLLANAFRYTPPEGRVSLTVSRDRNLFLEIADTGIGIPEDDHALVFEAFYRCRNVEGRRGFGLGLSIVKEALSQLNGTIKVASRPGAGTTMRVEIPVLARWPHPHPDPHCH